MRTFSQASWIRGGLRRLIGQSNASPLRTNQSARSTPSIEHTATRAPLLVQGHGRAINRPSRPRRRQRTARGRCGSLLLHRSGLAPPTPCRSPGAREGESAEAVLTCLKGWRAFHRLCERNFLPFTPKWIGRCDPRGVKLLLWSWLINAIARINRPSMIFTNQHRSY